RELQRQRDQLDNLFKKVSGLQGDLELQAHFARYLCILVSGFLENAIITIYSTYAHDKAAPNVANYVETQLGRSQNPNMERILQVSGAFNPQWRSDIENNLPGEVKDSVNSIVNTRNQIAHGESTGITYITIKNYYDNALKLIDFLRRQCEM
ncbi:MAG: MAE_28990/MAE_18760 family HEPN-like nuclease, partial [Chloroflexales bacterium]|nr:MAE_28990/MAE_18760 family HEPN-like nuclease [Chloroflexales bacterium]